jgi:predicted AAA+ superfamily ATPase
MINRILTESIYNRLFQGKILILYGARQVGKTTLAKHIAEKHKMLFLNCDLMSIRQTLQSEDENLYRKLFDTYQVVIIDEAQRVANI